MLTIAKFAVLGIVFLFLFLAVRRDLAKADADTWRSLDVNWWLVLAAAGCLAGMNTVQMVRYRSLLEAYGAAPTWRQMAAIAWIPPLGKYIPGSVWALAGAIGMLKRFGVNAAVAISVVLMVDAFSEIVGLIFSTPLLMRPPVSDKYPWAGLLAGPFLAIGVIAMAPPVFNRLLAFALRILKRPPLEHMPTWSEYVVPVLSTVVQWLFAGGALWCMTRSVLPTLSVHQFPQFVMIASCAMAIGYLVFLAPGGIGPREVIFWALLGEWLPPGILTIVIAGMRLLQIAVELLLAGLGAWMLRLETAESPRDATA